MTDGPDPGAKSTRRFTGRDWLPPPPRPRPGAIDAETSPQAAGTPAAGVLPSVPAAPGRPDVPPPLPRGLTQSQRDVAFQRYADLRRELGAKGGDPARLAEAAQIAEDLCLTLEAMELWRECLGIDPANDTAARRLDALERRALATGETGAHQTSSYRPKPHPPEAAPFWSDLGSLLAYPFRGKGQGVLLAASLFFAVSEILATFNVFFGGLIMLCMFGYLAAYQFDVVSRTAAGKDDPPEFPEFFTILDSCVFPFFSFLACLLFSFAPVLLAGGLMLKGWLPPLAGGIAILVLLVPCGFVFPMTLMARSLLESTADATNPVRVYGAIGRVLPDYLVGFVCLGALWFAWSLVRVGLLVAIGLTFGMPTADAIVHLDYFRILGWMLYTIAVWPLFLYVWSVQGHLLGRLYRQGYKRLAWFVQPGAETAHARRLSFSVALAGAGGAALLAGGAFLTYTLWPGRSAGGLSAFGGVACPVSAGSELTYFWESSDGPAGLVTYRFEDAGPGKLRVCAIHRRSGEMGVSRHEFTYGILDTQSGLLDRWDGDESGIAQREPMGSHTRFFGPRSCNMNGTYLNDWVVRAEQRWQGHWSAWKVVDQGASADLFYDKATGVLVGRLNAGLGFKVTEWLTDAKGVAGLTSFPAPNRTFPEEEQDPLGEMMSEPFLPPPELPPDIRFR